MRMTMALQTIWPGKWFSTNFTCKWPFPSVCPFMSFPVRTPIIWFIAKLAVIPITSSTLRKWFSFSTPHGIWKVLNLWTIDDSLIRLVKIYSNHCWSSINFRHFNWMRRNMNWTYCRRFNFQGWNLSNTLYNTGSCSVFLIIPTMSLWYMYFLTITWKTIARIQFIST